MAFLNAQPWAYSFLIMILLVMRMTKLLTQQLKLAKCYFGFRKNLRPFFLKANPEKCHVLLRKSKELSLELGNLCVANSSCALLSRRSRLTRITEDHEYSFESLHKTKVRNLMHCCGLLHFNFFNFIQLLNNLFIVGWEYWKQKDAGIICYLLTPLVYL